MRSLAVLLFCLPTLSWAQSYDLQIINTTTEIELEGLSSVEATQDNLTPVELNLRMELLQLSAPASWEIILCSPNFCAAPGEYDMLYQLDSAQHGIVKISFSPGLENGAASGVWVITDQDQPSNTDTINVSASTLVGVESPTSPEIHISSDNHGIDVRLPGAERFELISISGQLVATSGQPNHARFQRPDRSGQQYFVVAYLDNRKLVRRILF